jgi:hypothetical protein
VLLPEIDVLLNELYLLFDLFDFIFVPLVEVVESVLNLLLEYPDGLLLVVGDLVQEYCIVETETQAETIDDVWLTRLQTVLAQNLVVLLRLLIQIEGFLFELSALVTHAELSHVSVDVCHHLLEEDQCCVSPSHF